MKTSSQVAIAYFQRCPEHRPRLKKNNFILCVALLYLLGGVSARATDKAPDVLTIMFENDLLYNPAPGKHQDRHYTSGTKLIYFSGDTAPWWAKGLQLDDISERFPTLDMAGASKSFGLTFGQSIYTPENDRATNLINTDRPYAGWLYGGVAIQRRNKINDRASVIENFELDLGIIGPEAQGEATQNAIHNWRQLETFSGWDNQLKTEPALLFKYGRAWRINFSESSSRYFDIIPSLGTQLGNVRVSGNVGLASRLGWNLPDGFGVQTIDSPLLTALGSSTGPFGIYIFTQVQGDAVARNIFLDGNTFRDGPSVEKKPLVASFRYGLSFAFGKHFEASWTLETRTREFVLQKGNDQFGSLAARWKWDF